MSTSNTSTHKSWILIRKWFPWDFEIIKKNYFTCFLNCSWVLLQFRLLQKLTSRSSNKCKKNHVKGMSNPTRKALPCFLGNERREREERNWKGFFFSKDCLAAREVQLKMETEFFITCPSFFFFPSVKIFFSKVKAFCIF